MGTPGAARVDTAAVRVVAQNYVTAGSIVADAVRNQLAGLGFGATSAGRAYARHGDALRAALSDLAVSLREWSRASSEIAMALTASADRYAEADADAARRVG